MVSIRVRKTDYYVDPQVKRFLESRRDAHRQDDDTFIIICGDTGAGKTTLAAQLALYFDPSFNLDRIAFNLKQYVDKVTSLKDKAIILDESVELRAVNFMKGDFQKTITISWVGRYRHLFHIIVLKDMYQLNRDIVDRATAVFYLLKKFRYARGREGPYMKIERGNYYFYEQNPPDQGKHMILRMYDLARKGKMVKYPRFKGIACHFSNKWVVDKKEYDLLKEKYALDTAQDAKGSKDFKIPKCPQCGYRNSHFRNKSSDYYCRTCRFTFKIA